jgi:hypothetical protein
MRIALCQSPPKSFLPVVRRSTPQETRQEQILQFSSRRLAEQLFFVEQNIGWLALFYLVLVVALPVGVHTDFCTLCSRIDVLMSFFPVGVVD